MNYNHLDFFAYNKVEVKICININVSDLFTQIRVHDERFGGFLVPFLAGAVVSAPFWYLGANNKYQQQMYYQNQPYPMYYPYQNQGNGLPSYYPYPPYK